MVHVRPRSRSAHRVVYRYVTGRELDGVRRTNATWLKPGRDLADGVRHAWPWHYLPRNQRMAWRLGVPAAVVLLGWSGWYDPVQTMYVVQGLGVLAVAVFAYWFWTIIKNFENRHRFLGPLSVVLGGRWHVDPAALLPGIKVPADCRTNADHPAEVVLPEGYRELDRQAEQSAKIIAKRVRIPVDRMDYEIDWEGDRPKMLVRAQEVPPEFVGFETAKPYLEQATDTRYFLGIGLRGKPIWVDLDLDSPHLAFSFGSGGGKSTVIRLLAAQVLRLGGKVVILDHAKEGDSHADWVYDDHGNLLPGVEFHTSTEDVHEALIGLEAERARRSRVAHYAKRFKRPAPHFQRILVVGEELNTGTPMLIDLWKQLRKDIAAAEKAETGEASEQPLRSPAMAAMAALVNAGRAQRMNFGAVAQRFDAKVIGGGDVRASFMVRVLARFGPDAVRMLVPNVDPKPRSSNFPGRMVLALEGEAETLQAAYLTAEEAQEWALGGYRAVLEQGGVSDLGHDQLADQERADQHGRGSEVGTRTVLELPPAPEPAMDDVAPARKLTINEALDEEIVSGTYDTVYRAVKRAGISDQGRKGAALTYFEHELAELEERRTRKSAGSPR
jgi:hypothetical protein